MLGCISTSPGISNRQIDPSPSRFSLSPSTFLYVPEHQSLPTAQSQPLQQPSWPPPAWAPQRPHPHLTVVLPGFTLCHWVGEFCLLVAHLSRAVAAEGFGHCGLIPLGEAFGRLSPPSYAAYLGRSRGQLTSDQVLGYQ